MTNPHKQQKRPRSKMRLIVSSIAVLLVLCVVLVLSGVIDPTSWSPDIKEGLINFTSEFNQPKLNTDDLAPIDHNDVPLLGINTFLEQEVEPSKKELTLELIRDAGFKWVKQQVVWSEIEIPSKGQYYDTKVNVANTWEKYDIIVDLCLKYGLNPILRLDTTPDWARSNKSTITAPPDNLSDYGDFVYQVVSRYRGKVTHFQIWNEPNLAYEWGYKEISPKAYVEMLKVAYTAAKRANPDAVILSAALAPTAQYNDDAMDELEFLKQLYEAGAKDYFDIMTANVYGLFSVPYDRRVGRNDVNFSRPLLMRQVMVENGDSHKPIWASEMGWNALPLDSTEPAVHGRVTREQQARYTVEGLQRAAREWPWMGVVNVWHLRLVHPENMQKELYFFGILGVDFTRFPVYDAIAEYAKTPPVLEYGYRQDSSPPIAYSEEWTVAGNEPLQGQHHMANTGQGAKLRFDFRGTALSVVVLDAPDGGSAELLIDGKLAHCQSDDGKKGTRIDTLSDSYGQRTLRCASGLNDGMHSAELRVMGDAASGSVFRVDAFVVDRQVTPLRDRVIAILIGFVLTAATAAYFIVASRRIARA